LSVLQAVDPKLLVFPKYWLTNLVAFADAACATDIKLRFSITGYVIVHGGAAIAYKAKLKTTVATTPTVAEFIASMYTAKAVKYLYSVLTGPICQTTLLAIYMINA